MVIRLNVDTQEFKQKPKEFGALRNRLCKIDSINEITPEQLIEAVKHGRALTPAVRTGTQGKNWAGQHVICADIDNDTKDETGKKKMLENPLWPDEARAVMAKYGIDPYFMYYSFSKSDTWPKYRIVLILDEVLTEPAEAADLSSRFTGLFNEACPECADESNSDLARIYLGSRADSVFYVSGKTTSAEILRSLPAIEAPGTSLQPAQKPAEWKAHASTQTALEARLKDDIETFPLADYIAQTESSRAKRSGRALFFNPCPVCNHNDCFQVTGALWHCHSDNHDKIDGKKGGTIIDYLMHREKITLGAALEKFKFEIMGYSREDWKQEYMQKKQEAQKAQTAQNKPQAVTQDVPLQEEKPGINDGMSAYTAGAAMVQSFFQAISSRKYEPMPTGLAPLDEIIGGGFLRQTLVMMGAAPGMGKSFFAQQLFEGMAQQGHNVLYFNLEMSREQMLARSFARIARVQEGAEMTAIDVLQGYRWTDAQRAIVERTAAAYTAEIAPHIAYNPGGSTAQLDAILEQMNSAAQRATDARKEAPLVVIDYLHLLRGDQREDIQTTLKRAMDAFKGYAMKYNTVVFVILAFNRDSNKGGKVKQESGRDSSAIEYGADLMLGLNFAKVEDNQDSDLAEKIREAAQKEGQEKGQTDYRLKVLKNRLQGGTGNIDLVFSGKYGLFLPRQKQTGWQQSDEPLPVGWVKRI